MQIVFEILCISLFLVMMMGVFWMAWNKPKSWIFTFKSANYYLFTACLFFFFILSMCITR